MDPVLFQKYRSSSTFSIQNTPKQIISRTKSRNMVNVSVSNDQDSRQSYSILKLQMLDDGKVSISTNRRLLRTFSAKIIKDSSLHNSFVNTAQYFFHAPIKIPSPLHQITLKKQAKPIIVKLPEKRVPKKQNATSELIRKKILNAQKKVSTSSKYLPSRISIEPKVSYQKLFSSSKENLLKSGKKQNSYSITFDNKYLQKIHSIRDSINQTNEL